MRAKWLLPFVALALVPAPVPADPPVQAAAISDAPTTAPVIEGDDSAPYMAEVRVRNVPQGTAVIWLVTPEGGAVQVRVVKSEKAVLVAGPAGQYTVRAWLVKGEDSTELRKVVTLTNAAPVPPGPTPPGPTPPGPKPPDPGPTPPPVVTSFRVIFVYESANTLTAAQNAVLYSKSVGDYLNAKTTKDGNWSGWRRWDKDVNTANELPAWKALWDAVKPKLTTTPALVIEVNGKADIVPLPATPADAVALFRKYTGDK